jgi:hypothetical protein
VSKDPKLQLAWADLFVELLSPIAGLVKSEVNVPLARAFVDIAFEPALQLAKKAKPGKSGPSAVNSGVELVLSTVAHRFCVLFFFGNRATRWRW